MNHKINTFIVALGILAAGSTNSVVALVAKDQPKSEAMPTVDEVISKYVQAIGGKEAVEKLTSQVAKGSIQFGDASESKPFEFYKKAPDKWRADHADTWQGFNGKVGWQKQSDGVKELGINQVTATTRLVQINRPIRFQALFPKMKLKGKQSIGDHEAFVIETPPAEGGQYFDFDTRTGLLVSEIEVFDCEGTQIRNEIYYDDYRDVSGVKVPFTMRATGTDNWTIKFKEVKNNVPIEDAKFEKPSGK